MQPSSLPQGPLPNKDDPNVLSQSFELLRPYLLALANREMSSGQIAGCTGSDLVQDTFLAAYHQWNEFRGESLEDILGWLRAILRFQIFHLRRKQRKVLAAQMSGVIASPSSELAPPDLQLESLENLENLVRVLQLLQDMPELQRQIIEGRIERNETFKEIGKQLGMTEQATCKAFHRAVEHLRGHF